MLADIENLFNELEEKKELLLEDMAQYSEEQLRFQPAPDRWSMIMALQHIVLAEQGLRLTEQELRNNPLRKQLAPGELFEEVLEVLDKDVPVDVADPAMEPDNSASLERLSWMWASERESLFELLDRIREEEANEIMFSHPASGPLDPIRMLLLAHSHFNTHRRQIDKLRAEIETG